jgi:hypothetical protein
MLGQLPKLGLLYVQVRSRTFFNVIGTRETIGAGSFQVVGGCNGLPKVSKPVSGNLGGDGRICSFFTNIDSARS